MADEHRLRGLLLRTPIGALLEAPVKRWKVGPVEVEYWEKAVEVAGAVAVAVDGLPPAVEISAEVERTRRLAETAPTVAVVKAFGIVERRLREMAGTDRGRGAGGAGGFEGLGLIGIDRVGEAGSRSCDFWPTPEGRRVAADPLGYLDAKIHADPDSPDTTRLYRLAERLRASDIAVGAGGDPVAGVLRGLAGP